MKIGCVLISSLLMTLAFGEVSASDAATKLRIVCNRTTDYDDASSRIKNVFIFDQVDTELYDGSEFHHDNSMNLMVAEFIPFDFHLFPDEIIPVSVDWRSVAEYAQALLDNSSIPRVSERWEARRDGQQYYIRNPEDHVFDYFNINAHDLDFSDFERRTGDEGWMFCFKPYLVEITHDQ